MRKFLLSAFFYLIVTHVIAQPIINRSAANNTVRDMRFMAGYNLYLPRYADTTGANNAAYKGIDSCGALIFTYDVNAIWYRQCSPKKWVLLSNGNAPVYTADRGVKITGDNIIRLADTVQGAGTKLQWLYDKAAFRAGSVNSTQWDVSNIGTYSFSTGINNTASGAASAAIGLSSQATGINSMALGGVAIASGNNSVAIGNTVTASGLYSIALGGFSTLSSGIVSTATGNFTKAVGNGSLSAGVGTYMNTLNGAVFGAYNDTTGYYANNTSSQVSTDPVFVIGNGSGVGSRSNAFSLLRNGALKLSSGITATTDTTTFKPMVMDASGNVRKTGTWGIGVKNIYNSDGTLTGNRIVSGNSNDLTFTSVKGFYINPQDSAVYQKSIADTDSSRQIATTAWVKRNFAKSGTVDLVAGTATVNTDMVTANSIIILTVNTPNGGVGNLSAPDATIVPGVSFVINSTSITETSSVNWLIIN